MAMAVQTWFYDPPLPPFHEIGPTDEAAAPLLLAAAAREALVEGVEVYARAGWTKGWRGFRRGRTVLEIGGNGRAIMIVVRDEEGGTSHLAPSVADVILAELVDAGLLGAGAVMDWAVPVACPRCGAAVPRTSPTGRCDDRVACRSRVARARGERDRAAWGRFVEHGGDLRGMRWLCEEDIRGIAWACQELAELGVLRAELERLRAEVEALRGGAGTPAGPAREIPGGVAGCDAAGPGR
jgi:hypothetical protein